MEILNSNWNIHVKKNEVIKMVLVLYFLTKKDKPIFHQNAKYLALGAGIG